MISRQTSLSRNIVQFCRYLRQKGFSLSVDDETTALNALQFIDYHSNEVFRQALKAVLCRSRSQLDQFDALFTDYWKELEKAVDAKEKKQPKQTLKPGVNQDSFKALKSWLTGNKNEEIEQTASYSTHENLAQQDFSAVPADDLDEIMKSIRALSRRLAAQSNRRYEKSAKEDQPDLRRTLRKNMRNGGELMHLIFRKPKRNRTKLVVLCDVSQSMDLYSAFLLQFMYSFQQVFRRIETFAFSTSLQSITSLLKQNDFSNAMKVISAQNQSWSGGTRIGESLHQFVTDYAARLLDKRTIVIILSDGWDTGDITLLRQSMEVIHAKARKVIWLNPLAGYTAYRPAVAGMQTALPYIDVFAPVHNVDSLRKLGKWL
ncbi:VWA domain-containing protein [Nibrella viscosa]|uniref:VWA domain-containing protein n=1 Tax=Nibrella viscosa TaxID=1084524 RepID=A0ABP8JSM0_9BACT